MLRVALNDFKDIPQTACPYGDFKTNALLNLCKEEISIQEIRSRLDFKISAVKVRQSQKNSKYSNLNKINGLFLDVAETIFSSLLCCDVGIV